MYVSSGGLTRFASCTHVERPSFASLPRTKLKPSTNPVSAPASRSNLTVVEASVAAQALQ